MAFTVKNRTKQTSTTNGTTNVVMTGSVSGFQTFGNALLDGDTTYYAIVDPANGTWEVGLGTWASGTSTLTRTTIIESSSGSSAINFTGSVSKDVFITEPASKSLLEGSSAISNAEFLKKSGNVIEGRSAAEMRSDLNVEDGATANSAGNAITISSGVINHSDTSSQASSNNSGRTYIQDITLDTYGHVTGLATATETVTDTNTTYSAGTNLGLSGTTFNLDNSINLSGTVQATRYYIDGTSKYIDSVSGDYGTIRVQGNTGNWAGYAINDDWVFMSNGAGRAGLYNDTDNEWAIQMYQNAQVDLYYNANITLSTQSEGILVKATGNGTDGLIYLGHNYHSYIKNDEGSYVKITTGSNENFIYATENGTTYLYHNGTWRIRTESSGVTVVNSNSNDGTVYLGTSGHSKIHNDAGSYVYITTDANENFIRGDDNSYTYLYYNGSWRLRATNQGTQINGALTFSSTTDYGSSGQVLTSNGSSAPSWQDAGGGAHTIIKRYNGSNANSVQFINGSSGVTLDSTSYRGYRIVGWAIRNSGNSATNNALQVYTGNSSGYGGVDGYYLNYRWLYSQDQQFGAGSSNGGSWAYDANINYCIWMARVRGKDGATEGSFHYHTSITPIDIYFPAIGFASNRRCYCYSTETYKGYAMSNNYQISEAFLVGREKPNRSVDRIKLQMNVYGGQTSGGNMDYDFTLMGIN